MRNLLVALALCLSPPGLWAGKSGFSGGSSSRPSSGFSGGRPSTPSGFSGGSERPSAPKSSPAAPKLGSPGKPTAGAPGKPPAFDAQAGKAARDAEGRARYQAANPPARPYVNAGGQAVVPPPAGRTQPPPARASVPRSTRTEVAYAPYAAHPPVYYADPYHGMFQWWLLSQSLENQALWAHHHRDDPGVDRRRVDELLAKNADLRDRVARLERDKVPVDRDWDPPGIDPDAQFDDAAVAAGNGASVDWGAVGGWVLWLLRLLAKLAAALVVAFCLLFLAFLVYEMAAGKGPP